MKIQTLRSLPLRSPVGKPVAAFGVGARLLVSLPLCWLLMASVQVAEAQVETGTAVDFGTALDHDAIDSSLSRSSGDDRRPSFSWDGQWIAFESARDGNREVYVMDAEGHRQRRLTYHHDSDGTPSISPDGKSIVFQSNRMKEYSGDRRHDLWMVDFDGKTPPRQLTEHPGDDAFASFSPDGQWIVFSSGRSGSVNLYRLSTDDGTLERLTEHDEHDLWPSYSQDGKHILFFSKRDNNDDIYRIPAAGGEAERLTTHADNDFAPSYFPDGRLVFVSTRDGYNRLYKMAIGGEPVAIEPPAAGKVTEPIVSPDGKFLIFVSDGDDHKEIYRRSLKPEGLPEMIME